MNQSTPFIHIIGQGLAGTLLAFECLDRKIPFAIFDRGLGGASSMVAAGMWNPISIKLMRAGWRVQDFTDQLTKTYTRIEQELNLSIKHDCGIQRIFPDAFSANEWDHRSQHPEMFPYLKEPTQSQLSGYETPFGFGTIQGGGWVHVSLLLKSSRDHFKSLGVLHETEINHQDIQAWVEDEIQVIHATGWKAIEKSSTNRIPLVPNKGEVLTITADGLDEQYIAHFGNFIIPLGNRTFRLGATYKPHSSDVEPTEEYKNELLDAFQAQSFVEARLMEHQAGIRPTTRDRRPVVGKIPDSIREYMLGGLGSKGVLLAPYFAHYLIDLIQGKCAVDEEVNP
ncbi:MAG: NAD(P)/FAD-dependent oxidoreductase, partial [Flavobacteriales bacterium]